MPSVQEANPPVKSILLHFSILKQTQNDLKRFPKNPKKANAHPKYCQFSLPGATLLIFANKQDLPGAMSAAEIRDFLQLEQIKRRHWSGASRDPRDQGLRHGIRGKVHPP